MSDRNELAKLYAKRKTLLIGKQLPLSERASLELQQLCTDDMDLLESNKNLSPKEKKDKILLLISKSIDVKVDDVKLMAVAYMEELIEEIMKANDIADDDTINEMKQAIKDKALE